MPRAIGIDIGGTKMLGVVVDTAVPTDLVREVRLPTPRGTQALVEAVALLGAQLEDEVAPDAPVGIGIPGLVDLDDRFRYGPNLPEVVDVPLGTELGGRLGRRVLADNDATCATVAEFRRGAGRGHEDGMLLTIGTGIGGGIVIAGQIRHGAHGFAGEPGHMVVDPRGPLCPCGRRGCWERFGSGSGLARLGRDAATAGRLAMAVGLAGGDAEAVRGEHVVDAARAGDPEAGEVLDEFAWWLALGIGNLIDLLDPSIVVLGGGVMGAADVLLHRVVAAVPSQVIASAHRPPVPVVAAELGEHAGAIGAALLTEGDDVSGEFRS